MRPIDADELLKLIPHEEVCSRFVVENAPTIEPEQKNGKWVGKGSEGFGIFICDNCGKLSMMEYDFCPNCGCRMEESEK